MSIEGRGIINKVAYILSLQRVKVMNNLEAETVMRILTMKFKMNSYGFILFS